MNTTGQKATKKVNLDQVIKKEVEIFTEAQRKSNEGKGKGKTTQSSQRKGDHRKFYA